MSEIKNLTNSVNTLISKFDILINLLIGSPSVTSNMPIDTGCQTSQSMTLTEYCYFWLETYKKRKLKPDTYSDYSGKIKNYISPNIGDILLTELTMDKIQSFINTIELGRTRQGVYKLLKSIFEKAKTSGRINKNFCDDVELDDYEPEVREPLTKKEQASFINALDNPRFKNWKIRFMLYLTTGIRMSEILDITPDYKNKILFVNGTKTQTSKRYVPLTESMCAELKTFYESGLNFKKNFGNTRRAFIKVCEYAKIENTCVHSLRHTFATRCYEEKIRIEIISEWLGHSNIKTTKRYIHKLLEYQQKNAKLIEKVF